MGDDVIVYLVRNRTNDKGYVGKTKRSLEQRWREHVRNAMKMRAEMPIYDAIRKHGAEAFDLSVLEECDSPEGLNEAEKRWIVELGTFSRGYNATRGGDGPSGYRHTSETRARMSALRRGKKLGPRSEETKRRVSEGRKGKGTGPRPESRGWHQSEETRAKISEAQYVPVAQYDMSGNHVATYGSMLEAEQASGCGHTGISRACRFPHRTCGGFRWSYVEGSR